MRHKYLQISSVRYYCPSFIRLASTVASRLRLTGLFLILILPALACGFINPRYQLNNEVRLAVYNYEQEVRGKADDLVIDFQRDEPRIKFEGQSKNGGRTVWLYRLGAKEFFALRPPDDTYLYIQGIEYNDERDVATVRIFRGDGSGYNGWVLTLQHGSDHLWSVTSEVEIEE